MLKFIFSIGFAWIIGTGFAQKVPKKLLDSLQKKPRVESRIRLGFDLSKSILSLTQSRFSGGEVGIDYTLDRVLFEAHRNFLIGRVEAQRQVGGEHDRRVTHGWVMGIRY